MSQSTSSIPFSTGPRLLDPRFDLDALTSDDGLVWVAGADAALGLSTTFVEQIPEWRRRPERYALDTLIQQRLYQIVCGYDDQNDATTVRNDPLFKQVSSRLPVSGAAMGSQPTLSRLENAVDRRSCYLLARGLDELYLPQRERTCIPRHILLDLDSMDDPVHGKQECELPTMATTGSSRTIRRWSSTVRPTS